MRKLDEYTPGLMRAKGGAAGCKMRPLLDTLNDVCYFIFSQICNYWYEWIKSKVICKQLLCCAQSWAPYQLKPFNINVWIRSYPSIFFTALSVRVTRFLSQPSIYQAKGQGSLWTGRQSVAGPEFGLSICKSLPTPLTVLSLNCISLQTQNIEKKRDAVVCCLINYLGERQEDLFHDCQVCHEAEEHVWSFSRTFFGNWRGKTTEKGPQPQK